MKSKPAACIDDAMTHAMEIVGPDGRYQRNFGLLFNVGCLFVVSMLSNNIYMVFAVPAHWCHVPGRELTNRTVDEWKSLTLPREWDDSNVGGGYSKCQMFDIDWTAFNHSQPQSKNGSVPEHGVIDCRHGWDYDKEWYERTAVSQEDWVCEKDLYQTNAFAFGRMGEVLGSLIFGQLGDKLGRRKMFYISVIVLLFGKISIILSVSYYTIMAVSAVVGSLAANSIFQSPLIIALETNRPEKRAAIALQQNVSWSVAMCIMPLLFWVIRDWKIFFWVTTLPLAIFLFFPNYMIESPRWLATSGRLAECAKCLTNIARINGRPTDEITESYLKKLLPESKPTEQVYGMWSFFTGRRLARNTLLLIFCWCVCNLAYFTLLLSVAELPGNPFLNFLIQSLVEFPSYFLGQWLCNIIGRRFTNAGAYVSAATLTSVLLCVVKYEEYATLTIALTFATKFCTSVAFFAVNLQAMETYPTCLRQTGISLGMLMGNVVGMIGPYIVYLGKNYDVTYPYIILCTMFVLGSITAMFTVETHMQKLPDSLEEAMHFGEGQKFWSFPQAPKVEVIATEKEGETEKLNQIQYSP